MTDHNADRLRDAIARDQQWTLCRCGHILDCCADCRAWLIEHSPRIAAGWRWYVEHIVGMGYQPAGQGFADLAERDDRAYFGL